MELDQCFCENPSWGYQSNISGKTLTTFRIGGRIRHYFEPCGTNNLVLLLKHLVARDIPFRMLGAGSNVLLPDEDLCVVVIGTRQCAEITINGLEVTAMCGVPLAKLIQYAAKLNMGGLEALSGIPGTIGGAIYMNAGAFNKEISEFVVSVLTFDNVSKNLVVFSRSDAAFDYRESIFQSRRFVILSATIAFQPLEREYILSEIRHYKEIRSARQPQSIPNAGSTFKRPQGDSAARLIDAAGCKGMTFGGAQISPKHAGFIVNCCHATSSDVKSLVELVRTRVYEQFGVVLATEIEIW